MAKVGLKYLKFGKLNEGKGKDGEDTYGQGYILGKAIKADININKNDVKLYADDALAETDKTFSNGSVSVETSDISQENQVRLLGHSESDGEMIANTNDQAPYVGFGFYGSKKVDGKLKFRAVFFNKVQFGEPNDNNSTKGETTTFNTETIEGTIMTNAKGRWKQEKTFDTEEEAMDYIDRKFETAQIEETSGKGSSNQIQEETATSEEFEETIELGGNEE